MPLPNLQLALKPDSINPPLEAAPPPTQSPRVLQQGQQQPPTDHDSLRLTKPQPHPHINFCHKLSALLDVVRGTLHAKWQTLGNDGRYLCVRMLM